MLAALLLFQQTQTVTFSHPCARADVVLSALSNQLEVPLKATGPVESEYFLVRFDDVPVSEALEKIATALNATWSQRNGVRYLTRTQAQADAGPREMRARLEKGIAAYIESDALKVTSWDRTRARELFVKHVGPDGTLDRQAASGASRMLGPCREMLDEFVRAVGARKLASLPEDRPVTFRWSPKRGEQAIPASLRAKAETFSRSVNSFAEAARETGLPTGGDFDLPGELRIAGGRQSVTPDFVAFQATVRAESVYMIMMPNGVNPSPYANVVINGKRDGGPTPVIPEFEGTYVPSALAAAYSRAMVRALAGAAPKLDGEAEDGKLLLAWFGEGMTSPDPTHVTQGELLLQVAEAAGLNAVVAVSDGAFSGHSVANFAGRPLRDALVQLARQDTTIDFKNRWLIAYPPLDPEARSRFDRAATAKLALRAYQEGWARLDPLAEFAAACSDARSWHMGREVAGILRPLLRPRSWGLYKGTLEALKLYHTLPSAAKSQAKSEWVAIPYEDLPQAVRLQLAKAFQEKAFGSPRLNESPDARWSDWDFSGNFAGEPDPDPSDLPRSRLEVRVETADLLTAQDNRMGNRVYHSGMLTAEQAAKLFLESRTSTERLLDYSQLGEFKAERLHLRIRLANGESRHSIFTTDSRSGETRYYPVEQLPGETGERLRAEVKRLGG